MEFICDLVSCCEKSSKAAKYVPGTWYARVNGEKISGRCEKTTIMLVQLSGIIGILDAVVRLSGGCPVTRLVIRTPYYNVYRFFREKLIKYATPKKRSRIHIGKDHADYWAAIYNRFRILSLPLDTLEMQKLESGDYLDELEAEVNTKHTELLHISGGYLHPVDSMSVEEFCSDPAVRGAFSVMAGDITLEVSPKWLSAITPALSVFACVPGILDSAFGTDCGVVSSEICLAINAAFGATPVPVILETRETILYREGLSSLASLDAIPLTNIFDQHAPDISDAPEGIIVYTMRCRIAKKSSVYYRVAGQEKAVSYPIGYQKFPPNFAMMIPPAVLRLMREASSGHGPVINSAFRASLVYSKDSGKARLLFSSVKVGVIASVLPVESFVHYGSDGSETSFRRLNPAAAGNSWFSMSDGFDPGALIDTVETDHQDPPSRCVTLVGSGDDALRAGDPVAVPNIFRVTAGKDEDRGVSVLAAKLVAAATTKTKRDGAADDIDEPSSHHADNKKNPLREVSTEDLVEELRRRVADYSSVLESACTTINRNGDPK